jgi:O-antigen ligase
MSRIPKRVPKKTAVWPGIFATLTGMFLALAILKFGNPVIFDNQIAPPSNIFELIFQPWPTNWGYAFLTILVLAGLKIAKWNFNQPSVFALVLPLMWLLWNFISATQTLDANLTRMTLKHFFACVVCFYIGWFCLSQTTQFRGLFLALVAGFFLVIVIGWQQHFGGLEETRRFFYEQPNWQNYPADFLKKIQSNRIYSTLFYPNTLAAAILLVSPICVGALWLLSERWSLAARYTSVAALCLGALGTLFWSGSKSGWLLMLLLGFLSLLQLKFDPRLKKGLVIALVVFGLGGFAIKYAAFFKRGATSVVARFDYWRAAIEITKQHPLLGTGPGTFSVPYQQIKRPESEMARLCHNDYLEQACDSGVVGFLAFAVFVASSLIRFRPKWAETEQVETDSISSGKLIRFCVWLGLVGVALHSLVEFNLYIPAIAWPFFLWLGWLGASMNRIDKKRSAS